MMFIKSWLSKSYCKHMSLRFWRNSVKDMQRQRGHSRTTRQAQELDCGSAPSNTCTRDRWFNTFTLTKAKEIRIYQAPLNWSHYKYQSTSQPTFAVRLRKIKYHLQGMSANVLLQGKKTVNNNLSKDSSPAKMWSKQPPSKNWAKSRASH